jgi:hypothetical protein
VPLICIFTVHSGNRFVVQKVTDGGNWICY